MGKTVTGTSVDEKYRNLFHTYKINKQKRKKQEKNPYFESGMGYLMEIFERHCGLAIQLSIFWNKWFPLVRDGRLVSGEFCLPVMLDPPPPNYSYIPPDVCLPGTKWLDNHKGLFTVTLDTASSVHTHDPPVERFFTAYDFVHTGIIPARLGEVGSENELRMAMLGLSGAKPETIVKFLPVIFDMILELLVQPPRVSGQTVNIGYTCFEALCYLLDKLSNLPELSVDQHHRNNLLATYIQYQCNMPHPLYNHGSLSMDTSSSTLTRSTSNPDFEVAQVQAGSVSVEFLMKKWRNLRDTFIRVKNEYEAYQPSGSQAKKKRKSGPFMTTCTTFLNELQTSNMLRNVKFLLMCYFFGILSDEDGSEVDVEELTGTKRGVICEFSAEDVLAITVEIALQWVVSSGRSKDLAMQNAWFFFDLIIKSMDFEEQFLDDISTLVNTITADIISHSSGETRKAHKLNAALAFFFFDLLSVADRGWVFQLLKSYNKQLQAKITSMQDSVLHYVALNLPFASPFMSTSTNVSPSPSVTSSTSQNSFISGQHVNQERASTFAELSSEYRQHHYLAGIVLTDLATVLLEMHDPRHNSSETKQRVATLYMPLLSIVMDVLPILHHFQADKTQYNTNEEMALTNINQTVAMAIAGKLLPSQGDGFPTLQSRKTGISADVTRSILTCVLWVLKNAEREGLSQWLNELPSSRLATLLHLLDACASCFEYKPRQRAPPPSGYVHAQGVQDMRSRLEDVEYLKHPQKK
nr:unnamed protein product [Callosobruchus analis]